MVKDTKEDYADFSHSTWMSLVGLLHPYEFFVSVDQTTLWRRHLAWAKPKGKDIRDYTTQRFASNMVFLSLLLGADLNVLFNSANLNTSIRTAMQEGEYNLKFFVGVIIILSACSSVLGLMATFTAWGMISAISDCNAHSLLRSSMGEYVTSLPSRFVVASLYLFLLWFVLLIIEVVSGPAMYLLVGGVSYMFFQVVVSLSTFGRLIINTGAMGKKRILDPELERYLLPSGLHASLLIKATERSRRQMSVVSQYSSRTLADASERTSSQHDSFSNNTEAIDSFPRQTSYGSRETSYGTPLSPNGDEDPPTGTNPIGAVFESPLPAKPREVPDESTASVQTLHRGHRRDTSYDGSVEVDEHFKQIKFPRASVLNRAGGSESKLKHVVEYTLADSTRHGLERDRVARRQSQMIFQQRSARKMIVQEWEDEGDVRRMYGAEPPVPLVSDDDSESTNHAPRARFLNRHRGLQSLKDLATGSDGLPPLPPRNDTADTLVTAEEGAVGHVKLPKPTVSPSSNASFLSDEGSPGYTQNKPFDVLLGEVNERTPLNGTMTPLPTGSSGEITTDSSSVVAERQRVISRARRVIGKRLNKRFSS